MDFLKILKDNNEDEMRKYLFQYGKAPKPVAPFYIILEKEEESNNGRNTIITRSDETDPRNNCKTEVSK